MRFINVLAMMISLSVFASAPARNPFLAVGTFQSGLMSSPIKKGKFLGDIEGSPRIVNGAVNSKLLASPYKNFMWAISSQGISYVDVSNGKLQELASFDIPDIRILSDEQINQGLTSKLESLENAQNMLKAWNMNNEPLGNGVHAFVDKDNKVYYNTSNNLVLVLALKNSKRPKDGIQIIGSREFKNMTGMSITYDGKLVVLSHKSITVTNRDLDGEMVTMNFKPNETVNSSVVIDQTNGIYVASDKFMRKIVWTGSKLSLEEKDGGWISAFDSGSHVTPTLMGFGADDDKLVVLTDSAKRMNLVAFWREQIPSDVKFNPNVKSRRVAGIIPVTCGLSPLPEVIQSKQSVVVKGYGAFVVNGGKVNDESKRVVDVLVKGPVMELTKGVERFEWNPRKNEWRTIWVRPDVAPGNMSPAVSEASQIVVINSYSKITGWEVKGIDWNLGLTVHRLLLGKSNLGNGAFGSLQYASNADLIFNGLGGVTRISYATDKIKQAQETERK